jgi:hypothetical protein
MSRFIQTKDSPLLPLFQKQPERDRDYIRRVGGEGVLLSEDLPALKAQRLKVALLLMDSRLHWRTEIERVSGGAEGMRRLRELRQRGWIIEKQREGGRVWRYWAKYIPEVDYKILREMV